MRTSSECACEAVTRELGDKEMKAWARCATWQEFLSILIFLSLQKYENIRLVSTASHLGWTSSIEVPVEKESWS